MSAQTENKVYTEEEKAAYRQKKFDRYNAAYEEAATEIANGADEKIKKAENENKKQAILYTFYFMQDKNSVEDVKGVKISFGDNVRLYDILTKGKGHFLRVLNKKFNNENETKYHCGFFRRVNPDGNGFNEWNIYVSWKDNTEVKAKPENEEKFVKHSNKKGGFKPRPFKKEEDKVEETQNNDNNIKKGFGFVPRHGGRGFGGRGHPGGRGFHHPGGRGPAGRGFHGGRHAGRGHFQQKNVPVMTTPIVNKDGSPTWASKVKG